MILIVERKKLNLKHKINNENDKFVINSENGSNSNPNFYFGTIYYWICLFYFLIYVINFDLKFCDMLDMTITYVQTFFQIFRNHFNLSTKIGCTNLLVAHDMFFYIYLPAHRAFKAHNTCHRESAVGKASLVLVPWHWTQRIYDCRHGILIPL